MTIKQDPEKPVPPTDPNAEYMSVQETAWVFQCSVKTVRRLLKEIGGGSPVGRRIMTDKAERAAMYEHRRRSPKPGRPRRRTTAIRPATRTPARAAA
jgi:hypothetical protein